MDSVSCCNKDVNMIFVCTMGVVGIYCYSATGITKATNLETCAALMGGKKETCIEDAVND